MKKITLFVFLMISSLGFAQDLVLGFEAGESGSVGATFGDAPAPVIETGTGTNTTQVLRIVGNTAGEPWQGVNLTLSSLVNLTATKTMTMDVWSAEPITFLVKVTGGVGGPAINAAAASHPGGSTWQTVSFTFDQSLDGQAPLANGTYSGFVIHTYWTVGGTSFFPGGNPIPRPARTFFVDNIKGPLGTPPVIAEPTAAAPTPPNRPVADVKSIFSDAYTPVAVLGYTGSDDNTYNTSWCPGVTTLVQVEGNNTNRTTGLGCEGVAFLSGRIDATDFTFVHMDVWTSEPLAGKFFSFKFSNWNGTTGETNAFQVNYDNGSTTPFPAANASGWISIDIPLSSLQCINTPPGNACPNRSDFAQFVMTSNLGTIFYDNLYLHKNTTLNTNSFEVASVKLYPNPATSVLNIEAAAAIEKVSIFNLLGQEVVSQTPNSNQTTLDVAQLQVGVYIVKASVNGNVSSTRFIKE